MGPSSDQPKPVPLPVFRPATGEEEARAVAEVLASGWLGLGPKTAAFETEFASYVGGRYVVGLNSCTAALHIATLLAGVRPGDEVIVPALTFISTAHAAAYCGAKPVFADVDPATLSISFEDLARRITPRTRAVIPVHFAGRPVDVRALQELVGPSIAIIEDCAHAAGASYYGTKVGGAGNRACFSFHAVKNLAMGDGGALVLNTKEEWERARRIRWLGIDKTTWERSEARGHYAWQYDVSEVGLKCHLNDVAAAIGLVQLSKLNALNERRRQLVAQYNDALAGVVELPPPLEPWQESSWHIYHIQAPRRDALAGYLAQQGISTGVHYQPIHQYRCYGPQSALPVVESVAPRLLTLPLYPTMTTDDVERVTTHVRRFCGRGRTTARTRAA